MYIKPSARIYGESGWIVKLITCFRVNFNVYNLYKRQKAVDTIPPPLTPRTYNNWNAKFSSKTLIFSAKIFFSKITIRTLKNKFSLNYTRKLFFFFNFNFTKIKFLKCLVHRQTFFPISNLQTPLLKIQRTRFTH